VTGFSEGWSVGRFLLGLEVGLLDGLLDGLAVEFRVGPVGPDERQNSGV